jgi:hypothetical protein
MFLVSFFRLFGNYANEEWHDIESLQIIIKLFAHFLIDFFSSMLAVGYTHLVQYMKLSAVFISQVCYLKCTHTQISQLYLI